MHAQRGSAHRQVKDLPHRGIASDRRPAMRSAVRGFAAKLPSWRPRSRGAWFAGDCDHAPRNIQARHIPDKMRMILECAFHGRGLVCSRSKSLSTLEASHIWRIQCRLHVRCLLSLLYLRLAQFARSPMPALSPQTLAPPPVTFTADQDHQNMMDQLGIKALRPGPSGDEKAPNHANYDESKANPYPEYAGPAHLNNGQKVTTAQMWWEKRRPEIVEMYSRSMSTAASRTTCRR